MGEGRDERYVRSSKVRCYVSRRSGLCWRGQHEDPESLRASRCITGDFPARETGESSEQWEVAVLPLYWRMPANCPPFCRWPLSVAPNLSGWTLPPSTHSKPRPHPPTDRRVCEASWPHVVTEISQKASRSVRFKDKLGWIDLYAMDQIQVNIPLLLLLVAVKSKPCLWREESVCVCVWI